MAVAFNDDEFRLNAIRCLSLVSIRPLINYLPALSAAIDIMETPAVRISEQNEALSFRAKRGQTPDRSVRKKNSPPGTEETPIPGADRGNLRADAGYLPGTARYA